MILFLSLRGLIDERRRKGHPVVGAGFETFVIENCLNCAPPHTNATASGAEIDLLLGMPDHTLWAIEIKEACRTSFKEGFTRHRRI